MSASENCKLMLEGPIYKAGVLFLELKGFGSCIIGDWEPIISTYSISQKPKGVARLLFDNGCV